MAEVVQKRIFRMGGSNGSRIGIGTCPGMRLDIGERGRLRFSGKNIGIGTQTPCGRLEIAAGKIKAGKTIPM